MELAGRGLHSVEISGRTPAAAAFAAACASAAIPVAIIGSAAFDAPSVVSPDALARYVANHHLPMDLVNQCVDRRLTEDDATDIDDTTTKLAVVRRSHLLSTLMAPGTNISTGTLTLVGRSVLRIEAGDLRLGDGFAHDDQSFPSIQDALQTMTLVWPGNRGSGARWIRLSGEHLSEVRGTASVIVGQGQTALLVSCSIESLVKTSITLPDVIARLLLHPAVESDLPAGDPDSTQTRVVAASTRSSLSLCHGLGIRIGASAGVCDLARLDRELCSGFTAGRIIADAIADQDLTAARLSRIDRAWSKIGITSP